MQKILSFNTISSCVNILLQNDLEIVELNTIENPKQSEILVNSIKKILFNNKLTYNNVNIFSTIIGPGNFTSIKTSLAVLKAIQISTDAKIITNDMFEIISYKKNNYQLIILDMNTIKYYIRDANNNYFIIYKENISQFLEENKNLKILTNDLNLNALNIEHSEFSNKKWSELVYNKLINEIFTEEIKPLYIEEVNITKRKN